MLALSRHFRLLLIAAAAIAAMPAAARAQGNLQGKLQGTPQGKLEAHYSMTLAGIPIGKGSWVIDITDNHYMAAASGGTSGLLRVFAGGKGSSAAHGTMAAGQPVSSVYTSSIVTSKKNDEVRLTIANGVVKDEMVNPAIDDDPERVAITDEHRKGILDPMTASLLRSPGTGDPLSQEACNNRMVSVFDGRMRYDLQLVFKRMEHVKAGKGYDGPVLVCAVYFTPIAGFIPSRAAIHYVSKLRDIEVWLAPIAGTRVLVPFRVQGPTPIGRVVLEATEFVAAPITTHASANGQKTQ